MESKWKLVDNKTGKEIKTGDDRITFRDEPCKVIGFFYPHKPGSSGKVYVTFATDEEAIYYPGVINARYVQ